MPDNSRTTQYHFHLEGSGLGETTYRVSGAGELVRLRVRYEATDWQRKNSSYTDADWERDVVGAINLRWSPKTGQVAKRESSLGTVGWLEVRLVEYTEKAQS
jgi:hypothetical protein